MDLIEKKSRQMIRELYKKVIFVGEDLEIEGRPIRPTALKNYTRLVEKLQKEKKFLAGYLEKKR